MGTSQAFRFSRPTGSWLLAGLVVALPPGILGALGLADRAWWPALTVSLSLPLITVGLIPHFRSWRLALLLVPALSGLLAGTGIRLGRALQLAQRDQPAVQDAPWGSVPAEWGDGSLTPVRWRNGMTSVLVVPLSRPGLPPTTFKALLVEADGTWRTQRFDWTAAGAAARPW